MRVFFVVFALLLLGPACARNLDTGVLSSDDDLDEAAESPLVGYRAAFALTWNGARMGSAVEELTHHPNNPNLLRYRRRERIVVRRGDAEIPHETTIVIDTDRQLRAERVSVARMTGATTVKGGARRQPDGSWRVWFGEQAPTTIASEAVPAELVSLLVATSTAHRWSGPTFLPGFGFAVANIHVEPAGDKKVRVTTQTPLGDLSTDIDLANDGTVERVRGGDAAGARRILRSELDAPFEPPELVVGSSIPVQGTPPANGRVALTLEGVAHDRPPVLPGQELLIATADSWRILLDRGDRGPSVIAPSSSDMPAPRLTRLARTIVANTLNRRQEIAALAHATSRMLADDLGAPSDGAGAALALGRGDCTAHASLFTALARARGIPTRLVTGYRLDDQRLVRHRWAVAQLERGSWISVDPTYDEVPATPRLLGLAVHGESASELAIVNTIAFAGMGNARAHIVHWRD